MVPTRDRTRDLSLTTPTLCHLGHPVGKNICPKLGFIKLAGKLFPPFSPFPQPGNGKIFSSSLFLNIKLHFKKIKCPFCIFHWGRNVSVSHLGSVKTVGASMMPTPLVKAWAFNG